MCCILETSMKDIFAVHDRTAIGAKFLGRLSRNVKSQTEQKHTALFFYLLQHCLPISVILENGQVQIGSVDDGVVDRVCLNGICCGIFVASRGGPQ